jgi:PmbA protein
VTDVDLLGVARRVAGDARPGEQVEAYALRSRDVDVKVFGGEVESLAVAEVEGVGVRVVVDARQGYAWAGSLDDDVIAETLAEARDNAGFGSPDESYVLASPGDVAINGAGAVESELDLWREDVLATPTADKVALALHLEAAVREADPLVRGVESASYGDAAVEAAVANSLGVEASTRRTMASCSAFAMAGEGTLTQTGSGFSAGRSFADLDAHEAACDAAARAVRLLGAKPIPSGRLPVILDPLVTRSLLALLGGALSGEAIV